MSRRMMMAGAVGGKRLQWNYGAMDDIDRTAYSFTNVPLGGASDRLVVVCLLLDAEGTTALTVNSVTVGGVALAQVRSVSAGNSNKTRSAIYAGVVPSITSGNVVVTPSRLCRTGAISVYSIYGLASTTEVTDYEAISETGTTISFNLATNAGDIAISNIASQGSEVPPWNWTGLTEDYEQLGTDNRCIASASSPFTTANQPVTATSTGANTRTALVAAAWR